MRRTVFIPVYFVTTVAMVAVLMYVNQFWGKLRFPLSEDPAVWGQFGDYIGGVLNPLCAYMAFIWLARSYMLQKSELAETRIALEHSQQAQQLQAETSYAASRIEATNIHINVLGVQANIEREAIAELRKELRQDVLATAPYSEVKLPVKDVIFLRQKDLDRFEEQQRKLFAKILDIESKLEESWNIRHSKENLDE